MAEHVILFAGPMGAGKTTAIETLSEIAVIRTEAINNDRKAADKETTTVALDYGELTIDDSEKVRLYGVPGQRRFDFMWKILEERAKGLVLLVNQDAPAPIEQMVEFLQQFGDLCERGGVVVGVTRSDVAMGADLEAFAGALENSFPDRLVPVVTVDPRDRSQMVALLITLLSTIETRDLLAQASAVAE